MSYGIHYAVVTVTECKKITVDNAIYVKVFYYGTVSYLALSTDDGLNTTNNKTYFTELRMFSRII